MPRARPIYPQVEIRKKCSYSFTSSLPRYSIDLFRRTPVAKNGLSPSYRLGTALGTIGGVVLLVLFLLWVRYVGRSRPKSGSEPETESIGGSEWEQPPLPIDQGGPNDQGPHGDGRPIERVPLREGRPIEIVHDGHGRPLEQVPQDGGRPLEQVPQGRGRPLERVYQGGGRPLERAHQGQGRPLEPPPRGGRARRGGNRPLERAPDEGGIRGGETVLRPRGWTRPSRKKTAVRTKGQRLPVRPGESRPRIRNEREA